MIKHNKISKTTVWLTNLYKHASFSSCCLSDKVTVMFSVQNRDMSLQTVLLKLCYQLSAVSTGVTRTTRRNFGGLYLCKIAMEFQKEDTAEVLVLHVCLFCQRFSPLNIKPLARHQNHAIKEVHSHGTKGSTKLYDQCVTCQLLASWLFFLMCSQKVNGTRS